MNIKQACIINPVPLVLDSHSRTDPLDGMVAAIYFSFNTTRAENSPSTWIIWYFRTECKQRKNQSNIGEL